MIDNNLSMSEASLLMTAGREGIDGLGGFIPGPPSPSTPGIIDHATSKAGRRRIDEPKTEFYFSLEEEEEF